MQTQLMGGSNAPAKAKPRDPFTADSLVEFQRLYQAKFNKKAGNDEIWKFYESRPEIYQQEQGEPYSDREKRYGLNRRG